ncbi:MAG: chemotaxis protein CheB [Bacteroidota bacterium]|nr:chemotaxis protein CheB [Bacteroidota bacterium]
MAIEKKTAAKDKSETDKPLTMSANLFPVVGVGASAGGLEAFKKLIKAIPEDSGMAYVLVQHLDPRYESILPELLQKVTTIPVLEISDDIKVLPNHIYILPSNKMMIANDGVLELSPRPPKSMNERNLPIDLFFTSLADIHQSHAIGVVLSGTASDGTEGLKAIKNNGGLTFAQDEESAAHEGMPNSAVQAGVVDFILPPDQIPQKLKEIVGKISLSDEELQNLPLEEDDIYKHILTSLRLRKGTDFTYYKQPTIRRRILRRIAINKNESAASYLKYLRDNKKEQDILYQDLLIPVTEFFRDPKIFNHLCKRVFPLIIKNKGDNEPIRIWVAGCSTGEEVYSIAICLKEILSNTLKDSATSAGPYQPVQIFATDISEPAITKARTGIYTKNDIKGLSEQQVSDYFIKTNDCYQARKSIRDMCVFALHNFLKDPPFSRIDFISCRNVLIYMEPYLQKKALTTFHYALNSKGTLLLGKSETTSGVPELFASLDKKYKLFTRKDVAGSFIYSAIPQRQKSNTDTNVNAKREIIRPDFQKTADDILLSKYAPAGVVVNEAMDIVHFRGITAKYLEQSPGKASFNLLKMAKEGLAFELRNILHKAKKDNEPVIKTNIQVQVNDTLESISIEAIPLPDMAEPHYLILFHETNPAQPLKNAATGSKLVSKRKKDEKDLRIKQLEQELAQVREDMRSITEDQETVNEELQSANEELLSSSEELQSLNEEMETSKEELQSTNEELTVVNQEIIGLNEQVTDARDYAEAIVATVYEPLLVLNKSLRIKSANDSFYKTFQVSERDIEDRLMYELGNKQWNNAVLKELLEAIIPNKTKLQDFELTHNFPNIGERTMVLNAREMTRSKEEEKLILLSIEDITEKKANEKILIANTVRFRHLVKELPAAVYSCDAEGVITFYNEAAVRLWGRHPDITKDRWSGAYKIFTPDCSPLAADLSPVAIAIKEGRTIAGQEIIIERPDGTLANVLEYAQPEFGLSGNMNGAVIMGFNNTEQVLARRKVEESEHRYHQMIYSSPSLIAIFKGKDMVIEIANDAIIESWGKGKDVIGHSVIDMLPEVKEHGFDKILLQVYETGEPYHSYETPMTIVRNGTPELMHYTFVYQAQRDAKGHIQGVAVIASEVTAQVQSKIRLKESEERFRNLVEKATSPIYILKGEEMILVLANESVFNLWNVGKEAIGQPFLKIIPEMKDQPFWGLLQDTFKNGTIHYGNEEAVYFIRKNGIREDIYFNFVYQPYQENDGSITGVMVFATDVSEQVRARKKTEESESHFRRLADLLPSKISNADKEGHFFYFNKHWLDYSGMNMEELKSFGYKKMVHADDWVEFQQRFKKAAATETDLEMEMRFLNKDGEYKWHLHLAAPVKDEEGAIKMWVGATTEIQKIKEDEQLKGDFLKMVSHELKTPVTSIKGYVQLLLLMLKEQTATPSSFLESPLLRIDSQVKRLTRLIEEMLDLSRIESGKLELRKELFSLDELVTETVQDIRFTNTNHIINVALYSNGMVVGDRDRIEQVIINLVNNAIKYSPDNNVVEVALHTAENNQIAVSIKDYGIGIDAEHQQKIFNRFYRAGGKSEESFAGFGIGLFIAKEIIERHNGSISIISEKTKGSTFTFTLPLVTEKIK